MDSDSAGAERAAKQLRKFDKKIREALKLQEQQAKGRALEPGELVKVESLSALKAEAALLRSALEAEPEVAPAMYTQSWASASSVAASSAAATYLKAHAELSTLPNQPSTQAGTRASHIATTQRLAAERAVLEAERVARTERADVAEHELVLMLRAPFDAWGNELFWQLAMCEYALLHLEDVTRSPKQMQLDFRNACLEARQEVPRLHGSMQIDALQDALDKSPLLRIELLVQLDRYKGLYCSVMSGFGRFKKLSAGIGESLLSLMTRTNIDARAWRPPGATPAEKLALMSKEDGRYSAEWRLDTWKQRHEDAGRTISLRGAVGVTKAGLRRLKSLPKSEVPAYEHPTTVRLHDYQAHQIQRSKALANTFAIKRCALQWDEVSESRAVTRCAAVPRPARSHMHVCQFRVYSSLYRSMCVCPHARRRRSTTCRGA